MVDEKKFLDQNGVEYLWSQLSLEDYPNNETLIAVLNAIDQTKADKEEVDKQIAVMNDRVVATEENIITDVINIFTPADAGKFLCVAEDGSIKAVAFTNVSEVGA